MRVDDGTCLQGDHEMQVIDTHAARQTLEDCKTGKRLSVLQKFDAFDLVGGSGGMPGSQRGGTSSGTIRDVHSFLALMRMIAAMFHFESAQLMQLLERMPVHAEATADADKCAACSPPLPRARRLFRCQSLVC